KSITQLSSKRTKRAHIARHFSTTGRAERQAGDARSDRTPKTMLFVFWRCVNNIKPFIEPGEQSRNFLRLMLQVVVHCHNQVPASRADTAQQRIMLTVIAH